MLFDPLMKYGNYSYADVMLYPLAAALAAASDPDTKIYLAMQVCIPRCACDHCCNHYGLLGSTRAPTHVHALRLSMQVDMSCACWYCDKSYLSEELPSCLLSLIDYSSV